ncbi:MAG TPA: sigma-70 family RNA polymerase sigma factor [Solirubrobacteraceae bacterium]|nr:sigma-70 family RNA polymerase sigma factor [Solirubrobacteraceae bacterium]
MGTQPTIGPRLAQPGLSLHVGGDERLARQAGAGSSRAFASLYEKYHQQLYRYCRSLVRNDADAQDALQSTLAKALAALQRGQRDAPLRPWLFRIAHNESISLLRRRLPSAEQIELEECPGSSTEELVQTRARLAQLVRDLQALPERQRGALVMRELSGLSHEEIAIAPETTPGAAKQAIFDAREALAEFAEGRAMDCEQARRALSAGDRRVLRGRRLRAHMASCAGCAAFAAAIPARRAELRMLAPPIAPLAATGLLAQLIPGGAAHGTGGALGAGATQSAGGGLSAAVSAIGGKTIGGTLAAKALVGAAIVAAVAAGAATVVPQATPGGSDTGRATHGAGATGDTTHSSRARAADPARGGSGKASRPHAGATNPSSAARTRPTALGAAAPSEGAAIAHGRGGLVSGPLHRGSTHMGNRHVGGARPGRSRAGSPRSTRSGRHSSSHPAGRPPVTPSKSSHPGGSPAAPLGATPPAPARIPRARPCHRKATRSKQHRDSA